jgi:hypothetical protein
MIEMAFRGLLDNPVKICSIITYAKTLFPNMVPFTGSRYQIYYLLGRGGGIF